MIKIKTQTNIPKYDKQEKKNEPKEKAKETHIKAGTHL